MRHLLLGVFLAIAFVIFSVAIMLYISLIVPIGPWIEPTVALLVMLIVGVFYHYNKKRNIKKITDIIIVVVSAGGIGGIIASACAWSFPALYFVNKTSFMYAVNNYPHYCLMYLGGIVFAAGAFGLAIVQYFQNFFLEKNEFAFPIANLLNQMIGSIGSLKQSGELLLGMLFSLIFSFAQRCFAFFPSKIVLIKKSVYSFINIPNISIRFDIFPLLWSIGFIAGNVIAIPFLTGIILKLFFIDPCNTYFFPAIKEDNFLLAFCSGMVIQSTIFSFLKLAFKVQSFRTNIIDRAWWLRGKQYFDDFSYKKSSILYATIVFSLMAFYLLQFSLAASFFILITTAICVYQLMFFMAEVGLAPLGRFATFVMVPLLVFFELSSFQAVTVAAFVEIAGGVAASAISAKKLGLMNDKDRRWINWFQWGALLLSSLIIGIIFLMLVKKFSLGSSELMAQKAHSRALLLNVYSFDYVVLIIGFVFGSLFQWIRINSSLILGGLLMPIDWSFILVASGLTSKLFSHPEKLTPFWSGIFTTTSLLMLLRAFIC